jgi:hypothetical protein
VLVDVAEAKREEEVDSAAECEDEVRPEGPHEVAQEVARGGDPEAEIELAVEAETEAATEADTAQRERETRWKTREYGCGSRMRQQQTDAMQRPQHAPNART